MIFNTRELASVSVIKTSLRFLSFSVGTGILYLLNS